jgi:hypothetical protein
MYMSIYIYKYIYLLFSNAAAKSKKGIELDIFNNDLPKDSTVKKGPTNADAKLKNFDDSDLNYLLSTVCVFIYIFVYIDTDTCI